MKSWNFHWSGLIITGGQTQTQTDVEVFPANATCTIPPFPRSGKLSYCSSSRCDFTQREKWPLPLYDQRHPCGVRWVWWALDWDLVHIVEERPRELDGLPHIEGRLCLWLRIHQTIMPAKCSCEGKHLWKGSWKKLLFFWILSKLPFPPPPNLENLYNFLWRLFQEVHFWSIKRVYFVYI